MQKSLQIIDETPGSPLPETRRVKGGKLDLRVDAITARDLIRFRVEDECDQKIKASENDRTVETRVVGHSYLVDLETMRTE